MLQRSSAGMQRCSAAQLAGVLLLGPESGLLALPSAGSWRTQQTATGTDLSQVALPSAVANLSHKIHFARKHTCS